MAGKKRVNAFFDAQKFTRVLSELVGTLPSEVDKQRILSQLETLILFLSDLKARIQNIPTQQDTSQVRNALQNLTTLFDQAKASPVLSSSLGIKATPPRVSPPTATTDEIDRAKAAIARFESLTIDEIRSSLGAMNSRDLQAVAVAIGVRTSQRTAREALVHQIATKITNTRGYRSLRDGANES